ncbi:MAG: alpha/beta fold hydrolase [Alphaproteobacteria bacterium]|nr:alpha/beta fold hydrolase [Alphaproteobacteria bacterium]
MRWRKVLQEPVAIFPPPDSGLNWRSWAREMAAAVHDSVLPPPYPTQSLPKGEGGQVLLLPGFLTGDWAMLRLNGFLRRLGYRVAPPGILLNLGPTAGLLGRLDRILLELAQSGPVNVIGESFGGILARDLALRHPQSVARIVTLCTPVRFPVVTTLAPIAALLGPLHDSPWVARRHDIAAPLPVPVTAIYSPDDGIVDWRQCLLDDASRNIAVRGAHTTMGSNPAAQIVIAMALADECA